MLQDAGGDVAALCERPVITNLPARVVAQFTYDAYGQVQTADHLLPHPFVRAGHKGLFADRLDAGVADALAQGTEWNAASGAETPRLTPFATLVYDNRNRSYAPALGRFLQADPNATAMTLLDAASHSGRGLGAMVAAFDVEARYGDGANLYEYLGGNAWTRSDWDGLFFGAAMSGWDGNGRSDAFDLVDDFIAEDAGSKAAFMERITGGAHTAAYLTTYMASWIPGPVGISAGIANAVMGVPAELQGTGLQAAIGVLDQVAIGVNVGRMGARLASTAARAAAQYAARQGGSAIAGVRTIAGGLARFTSWEGKHHVLPIYMGGLRSGTTRQLTHAQHVEIHSLIDAAGSKFDIPTRTQGARAVEDWLLRNRVDGPTYLRMALIEAYTAFDSRHGTNLTAELFKTIMDQQWLP